MHAVLAGIKEGKWKEPVLAVREAYARGGKNAAAPLKKQLPGILFSGQFSQRSASALKQHSGLICADIDNLNGDLGALREKLAQDKHILACWSSPSDRGLKALVPIKPDAARHEASFRAAYGYFKSVYGVEIDRACKDVSRLCFVSYDPNLIVRHQAEILPPAASQEFQERATTPRPAEIIVLPSGATTISESAGDIFTRIAPSRTMFRRGRTAFEISEHEDGNLMLSEIKAAEFRSRVEKHGALMAWREENGKPVLKRRRMSDDDARAILAAQELIAFRGLRVL